MAQARPRPFGPLLLWLTAALPVATAAPAQTRSPSADDATFPVTVSAPAASPIRGWNLSAVGSWGANWLFADALRKASGFGSGWSDGERPGLSRVDTAEGIPLRDGKRSIIFHHQDGNPAPPGRWTLTWTGDGEARLDPLGSGPVRPFRRAANRHLYDVGEGVTRMQVVIDGDVRDPHLWLPNAEGQTWNPAALDAIRGAGVLRFMDWTQTNRGQQTTWDTRPLPQSLYQGTDVGVAWEHCLDLAVAVGASPWINIPPLADEDYCRQLGRLLNERMPAGTPVRVEIGNEFWNSAAGFKAFWKYLDQGFAYEPRPGHEDGGRLHPKAYAHLCARQWNALAETFPRARTVRVLGAQTANPWQAKTAARELELLGTDWDELALTFYFGGLGEVDAPELGLPGQGEAGVDAFFARVNDQIGSGRQYEHAAAHAALADRFGKRLVFYEGGSHARAYTKDRETNDFYLAVNRDPRMAGCVAANSAAIRERFPDAVQCYFTEAAFYDPRTGACFGAIDGRTDQWNDPARNDKWRAFVNATAR